MEITNEILLDLPRKELDILSPKLEFLRLGLAIFCMNPATA
ncbi:MAG TPA: hypothetical protein VIH89_02125 [Candidatus Sulfotelmatobacter sp.]